MDILKRFINNLCGDFNNDNQIKIQEAKGKVTHPKAKHINRIANNKINNLPSDFNGYFIIEESYYEIGNRKNILTSTIYKLSIQVVELQIPNLIIYHHLKKLFFCFYFQQNLVFYHNQDDSLYFQGKLIHHLRLKNYTHL
nr:hypothetical protein [Romboutsia sp. 13368]